ncbi:hypothetical protein QBZ16_004247 [Prototheca wickerhamii]|uniref:Sphingomyelin synthase-like domain-containing protein n=1 Tax=Prototheca wickerhamii TaxID=3111 RepID=A0AAD9MHV3_PROWI|nr:hypothetical protein QBZ16_004247 [Prototheca wickerhamii]
MKCRTFQEWAEERWRRIRLEFTIELPLLKARWKQVLFGAVFQYFHGVSTQLAHRMHRPQEDILHDVGFELLPEVGLKGAWISESIFWSLFIPFVLWTFSPFVTARKRFYTAVLYARLLVVLSICQCLRIISFTVTQLPAPNYHCRLGEPTAVLPMPEHWWQHVIINVGRQATHGCGDLIFSSHTTFVLVGCLTFTEYGSRVVLKVIGWIGVAAMSLCIVASRKHYSVDVVVAWYTVPLVFYTAHRRWTTQRPVQESWPHRPLVGEEGFEILGVEMLTVNDPQESKGLLLPASGGRAGGGDHKRGPGAKPAAQAPSGGLIAAAPTGDAERRKSSILGGADGGSHSRLDLLDLEAGSRHASSHLRTRSESGNAAPGGGRDEAGGPGAQLPNGHGSGAHLHQPRRTNLPGSASPSPPRTCAIM